MKNNQKVKVIILVLLFVIISLLCSFFPEEWNFGFNRSQYFSIILRSVLLFIVIISISTKVELLIYNHFRKLKTLMQKIFCNKHLCFAIISLFFLIIFLNFKEVQLYGDGVDIISRLDENGYLMTNVLTDYCFRGAKYLLRNTSINSYNTIGIINSIAGMIFIYITLLLSDEIGKSFFDKIFLFSFISTMGSMALFFGHIEVYSLFATSILAYIYLTYLFIHRKISIIWPSMMFSIACLFHMSGGILFPSLILVYFWNRKNVKKEFFLKQYFLNKSCLQLVISVMLPLILMTSTIFFFEWNSQIPHNTIAIYGRFAQPGEGFWGGWYPIRTIKYPSSQRFTLFSLNHMSELVNIYFLISPIGIIIFLFIWLDKDIKVDYKDAFLKFLVVAFSFYFLYSFFRALGFGMKDWDHFSPISIIYTVLGLYILIKHKTGEEKKSIYLILLSTAIFHLVPWILFNANRII
ncbi:MAG: hypothetical protein ABIC91_00405 [Nanoarchaeota archaeon]